MKYFYAIFVLVLLSNCQNAQTPKVSTSQDPVKMKINALEFFREAATEGIISQELFEEKDSIFEFYKEANLHYFLKLNQSFFGLHESDFFVYHPYERKKAKAKWEAVKNNPLEVQKLRLDKSTPHPDSIDLAKSILRTKSMLKLLGRYGILDSEEQSRARALIDDKTIVHPAFLIYGVGLVWAEKSINIPRKLHYQASRYKDVFSSPSEYQTFLTKIENGEIDISNFFKNMTGFVEFEKDEYDSLEKIPEAAQKIINNLIDPEIRIHELKVTQTDSFKTVENPHLEFSYKRKNQEFSYSVPKLYYRSKDYPKRFFTITEYSNSLFGNLSLIAADAGKNQKISVVKYSDFLNSEIKGFVLSLVQSNGFSDGYDSAFKKLLKYDFNGLLFYPENIEDHKHLLKSQLKIKWFNQLESIGLFNGRTMEYRDSIKQNALWLAHSDTIDFFRFGVNIFSFSNYDPFGGMPYNFSNPNTTELILENLAKNCQGSFSPDNFSEKKIDEKTLEISFISKGKKYSQVINPTENNFSENSPLNKVYEIARKAINFGGKGRLYYCDFLPLRNGMPYYFIYLEPNQVKPLSKMSGLNFIPF